MKRGVGGGGWWWWGVVVVVVVVGGGGRKDGVDRYFNQFASRISS